MPVIHLKILHDRTPVSYTHLDVYKRQIYARAHGTVRVQPVANEYLKNVTHVTTQFS